MAGNEQALWESLGPWRAQYKTVVVVIVMLYQWKFWETKARVRFIILYLSFFGESFFRWGRGSLGKQRMTEKYHPINSLIKHLRFFWERASHLSHFGVVLFWISKNRNDFVFLANIAWRSKGKSFLLQMIAILNFPFKCLAIPQLWVLQIELKGRGAKMHSS